MENDFDVMKIYRDEMKARQRAKASKRTPAIESWCNSNNVPFEKKQDWHLRIGKSPSIVLDIFPQTKKYHNVTYNKRGVIKGLITDFIKGQLIEQD